MEPSPTASDITVREILAKFESDFLAVANAVGNGEFALWVGSGISREAPSLGDLIERAFEFIRVRAIDPATEAVYMPALHKVLDLAETKATDVEACYGQPLAAWPEREKIIKCLWNKYSRLLDIRIAGTTPDFILWDAIDIRAAFVNPAPPAAAHLCIAILILERAVREVASANWDGFIEAAVTRLSNNVPGVMQVVVDPVQLRGPAGWARLLKFHGCIAHATDEPDAFRRFLTGSHTQIMAWHHKPEFAAVRGEVVGLATTCKTLVLGLSIQDMNLQGIFSKATQARDWPWPCAPDAPAHVFCEDVIQQGQDDVLRLCYDKTYNDNPGALQTATLLRAWGEKVLIALVLKLLADKLISLMALSCAALGKAPLVEALAPSLKALRDAISDLAVPVAGERERTTFSNKAIATWSRMLSLFRSGELPANAESYEQLSSSTPHLMAADPNALATGLGRLGVALSLLQHGGEEGLWDLRAPAAKDLTAGAMTARARRPGSSDRPIFLVKSATEAITLQRQGALANAREIVIHADNAWHQMSPGGSSARRVRAAPGRTGQVRTTHVSLGELLERCPDAGALQLEFVAELML